jgi:hypothetical protein
MTAWTRSPCLPFARHRIRTPEASVVYKLVDGVLDGFGVRAGSVLAGKLEQKAKPKPKS